MAGGNTGRCIRRWRRLSGRIRRQVDGVLLQQPVYYPFSEVITDNGRKIVNSPLKITDGYYTMDLDDLETKIVRQKVKLFLLCSPHNPVGRVWSEEELRRVGEICLRHGVLVVSDEIHSDFTREGQGAVSDLSFGNADEGWNRRNKKSV